VPRYFFHTRTSDKLIWDTTGLELPEIAKSEDQEMTLALWSEVFDRQLRQGRALVITDEVGKVLFTNTG
jgi:hypothetical protein